MRRSWRIMSALALVVASGSMFLSVVLYTRVQASRRDVCEQTNQHHDQTIAELDRQIAKLPPARKARAKANKRGTVALIDALAPKRDCDKLVELQSPSPTRSPKPGR